MRDIGSWDRGDAGLLTRDGRLLIRASAPTGKGIPTIRLLEVATGKERLRIVANKEGCFEKIALSPDEGVLATAHDDHIIQFWDLSTGKELLRHPGYSDSVSAMAFSPNGKYLATGHEGGEILAWDASLPERPRLRFAGTPNDLESWWKDLAADHAARAHRAISMLVDFPHEALALFKDRLRPAASAPVVDTMERIAKLIAQLDDDKSAVREAALNKLEGFGLEAEPALRQALQQKISLEKRRRIKEILEHPAMPLLDPELLRAIRAVEVLEDIATLGADASRLAATDLLHKLAGGDPNARLTQESHAALRRLRHEG